MDIIIRHDRIPNTQAFYQYGSMVSARPVSATPAQIRQCPTMLQIAAHRHQNIPPNQRAQPSTLQSRLLQLDPSEQQLVGTHLQMPHHEASFKQDLLNGKVHSGSDGSVKSLQASHSWVLQSSRTGDFMASHARTYPLNQQLSSKRPEAAGHAAALIVTRELLQGHSTPINATMRFHIDNKAVVKGSQPTHKRGARSTLIPEWDLMDKIHVLKQSLPIQTATIWVMGHQDTPDGQRRIPIKKLSFAAQLNCHADALATSHHHCHTCNQKTVFHPPHTAQAYILVDGKVITSHLAKTILSTCRRAALKETILKQTGWEPAWFDWVAWPALGRSLRRVGRHLRVTTAKLQFNLLASAVHMHTHGNKKIDKRCFRCRYLREDFDHILWCPNGRLARPAFWKKFCAVLTSLHTAPYIQSKLEFGLTSWQQQGKDSAWPSDIPPYGDTIGRITHMAFFEQEQLGWEQALRGRLSKKWGEAQDQYYKDRYPDQLQTGDTWTTRVITALWDYSKDIWMKRNSAYHGVDDDEARLKRSDDLNDLIVRSYQLDRHHVQFLD